MSSWWIHPPEFASGNVYVISEEPLQLDYSSVRAVKPCKSCLPAAELLAWYLVLSKRVVVLHNARQHLVYALRVSQ